MISMQAQGDGTNLLPKTKQAGERYLDRIGWDRKPLFQHDEIGSKSMQGKQVKRIPLQIRSQSCCHKEGTVTIPNCCDSHHTQNICTGTTCAIASTNLCLPRNTVYQVTCRKCNKFHIGSTTRFVQYRIKEHLNNSSVKKKKTLQRVKWQLTKTAKVLMSK